MQSNTRFVRKFEHGPLAYILAARKPSAFANDNGEASVSEAVLAASLRHFAQHGLSAARVAREKAEHAFFAGHSAQYRHWLGVCRALDKRMAMLAARELEPQTDTTEN